MKSIASGEILKRAKRQAGMTYRQIADAAGVNPEKVRWLCRGAGWTEDLAKRVFSAVECPKGLVEVYRIAGWAARPRVELVEASCASHKKLIEDIIVSLRGFSVATDLLAGNAEKKVRDTERKIKELQE